MSYFSRLATGVSIGSRQTAASEDEIDELVTYAASIGATVPSDYLALVRESSETEFGIGGYFIRVFSPLRALEFNEAYGVPRCLPGALQLADDEGGQALVMFEGREGKGLYAVSYGDLDPNETAYLSPGIGEFLSQTTGIEAFRRWRRRKSS